MTLQDGVRIVKSRLSLSPVGEFADVSLYLEGDCITPDQARTHYRSLKLIDTPDGHSVVQESAWTSDQPWGQVRLGFLHEKAACLQVVTLETFPKSKANDQSS